MDKCQGEVHVNTIFFLHSNHLENMRNGVTKTLRVVHILQNYNGKVVMFKM